MGIVDIVFAEEEKRVTSAAAAKISNLEDNPIRKTLPFSEKNARFNQSFEFSKRQVLIEL